MASRWGQNIRLQRLARSMSQTTLAEAVGVTQAVVSQWELGRCAPSPDNQLAIANALRVDARILFAYPQEVA